MTATATAPLRIGRVALTVHDLDRVGAFYQEAIGLQRIAGDETALQLGAGGAILLELRRDSDAPRASPREAGLFHTAFLLPSRADLGRWLTHAASARLQIQGASDHLVSEAVYLADPEGNGIEIYADRPRAQWRWAEGAIVMATEALDVQGVMASGGGEAWRGAPAGTTVGHVHLQVGAIPAADAFYGTLLGFDLTCRYPGASFFGSGGYHHHFGANIWNSRGARVRPERTTGLAEVEIVAADAAIVAAIRARAERAPVEAAPGRLALRDPWGTKLAIVAAGA
ncbi:MAG: VOC family protein [Roseiarcus sp.]|jgi:catechol 2,3-dioxygenase